MAFLNSLSPPQRNRVTAVARTQFSLHRTSHFKSSDIPPSRLWQCSTSLFSLTSFQELSNEAFLTSTSLLLGLPIPHALYLRDTQPQQADLDIWADSLLNKSAHAADSRKSTHTKFAQELTRIANECGIPTTCNESRVPYRDEGRQIPSRKRADMMTLVGGVIPPNYQLSLTANTKLIMDVTIGHTFDTAHRFKSRTLQTMESSKRRKYDLHYLRQRYAFAPMVANSLGQCGPDLLQFLWTLADHHAKLNLGFSLETAHNLSTQQDSDYRRLRGLKYHENRLRLLTFIFEAVTSRIYGATFNLTCTPAYHRWLTETRHNWLPFLPVTDPILSETFSQSSSSTPTVLSHQFSPPSPQSFLSHAHVPSSTPQLDPSQPQQTVDPSSLPASTTLPNTDPSSHEALALNARVSSHRRIRIDQQDLPDLRPSRRRRALSPAALAAHLFLSPLYIDHEARGEPPLPNRSL